MRCEAEPGSATSGRARRPVRLRLLMLSLLTPVLASPTAADATTRVPRPPDRTPAAPSSVADVPIGSEHPSVPGMFYWGAERGWGRYVERVIPARNDVIYFVTAYYTSSASIDRIDEARRKIAPLGLPVLPRLAGTIQEFFPDPSMIEGGISVGCVVMNDDGSIAGAMEKPCWHSNAWSTGPNSGFSWCDLRSCMTTGHRDQGGYQRFLAHNEVWSWVTWTPPQRNIEFEPCGTPCGSSTCTPGSPGCPIVCPPGSDLCTDPCIPGTPECVPPCAPGASECSPPCPPGSPGCGEICRDISCAPPPPDHCEMQPDDPRCRERSNPDARYQVIIEHPESFAAKGTLLEQGASVRSVRLMCGTSPCRDSATSLDPSPESLTGRLTLNASSSRYAPCRTSSQSGCSYLEKATDREDSVVAGDRVSAFFFSPTATGETMRVQLDARRATVQTYRWSAVYEFSLVPCAIGECYDWVFTGNYERVPDRVVEVPVDLVSASGAVVTAQGIAVKVIGSVGR